MKHYCQLAEIPREKAFFHSLKHSAATSLLSDQRESIVDVQRHLGHADIRSTMIYAQLTEQANEERANRLRNWR
jgi:integrase